MTIFGKSARDTFLMAALAQAGITEETVTAAQAAGKTDFLGNLGDEQAAALQKAETFAANLTKGFGAYTAAFDAAGINIDSQETPTALLQAHIEAREAAARKAGEDAAMLRAASELAARGHAPVATAPAAAADGSVSSPAAKLNGFKKVEALIAEELSRQNPAKQ